MTYTEAYRHFLAVLRVVPTTPAPALRADTAEDFHAWKAEMRAWDAARIKLKLATAQEVQAANDAFGGQGRGARIVQRAPYP